MPPPLENQPPPGPSEPPATAAPPDAQGRPANHLIGSTSPYLLQHAHNPVDWFPWGPQALALARAADKPIFLSIGYAACHWCHVMEREVFENPEIAAVMNAHFINIKVDREERPDLDELYMLATQLMTGSGGWPMSVWLTPSLEPFYAGTYFPPDDRFGRPGFVRVEQALADAWQNRREGLLEQSRKVVEAIRMHADETAEGAQRPHPEEMEKRSVNWIGAAMDLFADRFDGTHGGLGGAPKFPPHQALHLWLCALHDPNLMRGHGPLLQKMTQRTLDGMMNGGIYDHVGGGFARYSTDDRWFAPHFEKMLYDSAQLAPLYASASVWFNRPDYARVATDTLDFFLREMTGPRGEFYSSLDADSEGEEGRYYVWTIDDLRAALPDMTDAAMIVEHFGMSAQGNWHESPVPGGNILAVHKTVEAIAGELKSPRELVQKRIDAALLKMREFRKRRTRPGLDDKVLTAWNGLMVSALAATGRILKETRYLEAAHRLIGFLLTHHVENGRRLLRVSRGGVAHTDAYLDDHAYLLHGLIDLIDSTAPSSLPGTMARRRALEMADTMIRDFEDAERGGFYFTSPRHEALFARMKNAADNATPSANGIAIRALLRLARISGKEHYRETALRAVAAFAPNVERRPDYFPTILLALQDDHRAASRLAEMPPTPPAGSAAATGAEEDTIPLKLKATGPASAKAGSTFAVLLRLTIPKGYYLRPADSQDAEEYKTLARIRTRGPDGEILASQTWTYPEPAAVDGGNGYGGTVEFRASCTVAPAAPPGVHVLRVTVLAQACSATACFAPQRAVAEFMLRVDA